MTKEDMQHISNVLKLIMTLPNNDKWNEFVRYVLFYLDKFIIEGQIGYLNQDVNTNESKCESCHSGCNVNSKTKEDSDVDLLIQQFIDDVKREVQNEDQDYLS